MNLTMRFHGLCALVMRDKGLEAFLLPGNATGGGHAMHGGAQPTAHSHAGAQTTPKHEATMTAALGSFDLRVANGLWEPTLVTTDPLTLEQTGVWQLGRGEIVGTTKASTPFVATAPADGIMVPAGHEAVLPWQEVMAQSGMIGIRLPGGILRSRRSVMRKVFYRGSATDVLVADAIEWFGDCQTLSFNGLTLELQLPATIAVTNVARVPGSEGLRHFHHYYAILDGNFPDAEQVSLGYVNADDPIWDCVPPWPRPGGN